MKLLFAFLLFMGWPHGDIDPEAWTYNLKCYDCWVTNTFYCSNIRVCPYEIRRCLTISSRYDERELFVYKNCTNNCTFVHPSQQPPEAPRRKYFRSNSFYFVHCCNSMTCNEGGISNLERDILPEMTVEEELEGTVRLGQSTFFLSFASIAVSNTLT